MPNGIFKGDYALTVNDMLSAAILEGDAYYVRVPKPDSDPLLANGGTLAIVFEIPEGKDIQPINRIISYSGYEITVEVFLNPTFTPNTPLIPTPYNAKDVPDPSNPGQNKSTGVRYYVDPVISDNGTPLDEFPEYYYGQSQGANINNDSVLDGVMRVIGKGSTALILATNLDSVDARYQYQLSYIEKNYERSEN